MPKKDGNWPWQKPKVARKRKAELKILPIEEIPTPFSRPATSTVRLFELHGAIHLHDEHGHRVNILEADLEFIKKAEADYRTAQAMLRKLYNEKVRR